MGKRAISDLGISRFHLVQRHTGHKTARGGDFQPIIIDSYLNMRILQITAIHNGIDDKLPDTVRRQLIDVFTIDAFQFSPKMNVTQHKLERIIDLLPQRSAVLTFIHKNSTGFPFEHSTLNIRKKIIFPQQKDIPIGGMNAAVLRFGQQSPAEQHILGHILDRFFLRFRFGIGDSYFFHLTAQLLNFLICYRQIFANHLIIGAAFIFIVHLCR